MATYRKIQHLANLANALGKSSAQLGKFSACTQASPPSKKGHLYLELLPRVL